MNVFEKLITDIGRLWGKYAPMYFGGMKNTLILATVATLIGCLIGLICGILNTIPYSQNDSLLKKIVLKVIRFLVRIYVEFFRGTPMVLQAVFVYYGLPYLTNQQLKFTGNSGIWLASLIVVSINTGAYMAESIRGGIMSIDPGQTEGAKSIGMTHLQTMRLVILPQAIRNIMPQIGNNFIINLKDTSVMFVIGFVDFFAAHRNIVGINLLYFPSALIEMLGYLCMTLTASILLRLLEKKLAGKDSYELVSTDQLVMSAGTYRYDKTPEQLHERNTETKGV